MNYLRPSSLAQALAVMQSQPQDKWLAGGQSLLPSMRMGLAAPEGLIDLQALPELHTLQVSSDRLVLGAMLTHASIARHPGIRRDWPMLAKLAGGIGDQQIRHCGTVGGSLANNDPAACWPAAVLALDGVVVTNQRRIAADDFFTDLFQTALAPDELLMAVEFSCGTSAWQASYEKFEQLASRFALTGVALARSSDRVRVAITGLGGGVCRWTQAEEALQANFQAASLDRLRWDPNRAFDDLHASARYRAHLVKVLTVRAIHRINQAE